MKQTPQITRRRFLLRLRRGSLVVESAIAVGLLAVVFTLVVQSLVIVADQRRRADSRRAAEREAANLTERIMAQPWDSLDQQQLAKTPLSPEILQQQPAAELHVDVTEAAGPPAGRRVRLQIGWPGDDGRWQSAASLTAWRFHSAGAAQQEGQP